MKLYAAPRTRAVRVAWLLEELQLEYELQHVTFKPTSSAFFIQDTPTGKVPTLEDGDVVMCESGAIMQYLLGRYGNGQLQPDPLDAAHAAYLQWLHFSESTAFPPVGIVVWLTVYRDDATEHPQLVEDARGRARTAFRQLEQHLAATEYLAGDLFTAADISMGFTLVAASMFQLLDDLPHTNAYLARLMEREACKTALEKIGV